MHSSGNSFAYDLNASSSVLNAITYECAIVPINGMEFCMPASTVAVPENPAKNASSARTDAANLLWALLAPKSITGLPCAAYSTRAHFVAKSVCRLTVFISIVSIS